MKYIVFKPFQGIAANGESVDLPIGSEFETIGFFIAKNNSAICRLGSLVANQHFAINDDGNGLQRGHLTYHIAYELPFSEAIVSFLQQNYPQFLKDSDALLFNQDFFDADIATLQTITDELENFNEIQGIVDETIQAFTTEV